MGTKLKLVLSRPKIVSFAGSIQRFTKDRAEETVISFREILIPHGAGDQDWPTLLHWESKANGIILLQSELFPKEPDGRNCWWAEGDDTRNLDIHISPKASLHAQRIGRSHWKISLSQEGERLRSEEFRHSAPNRLWVGHGGVLLWSRRLLYPEKHISLVSSTIRICRTGPGWALRVRGLQLHFQDTSVRIALPPGAGIRARLNTPKGSVNLQNGTPLPGEPDALEWPIDFDWVTQDQTAWIDLETNLLLDGKSPLTALHQPASIQVHIDQVRAWVRGKREEAITEDVALDTLWLAASRESLFPLPLQLHFRVENEDWSKKVGAERVSGLTEKGYLYRLSTPLLLPQHLRPGRLWVRPEGQDQDAGSLGLPFSMLRCRWKMVLGSNNSAETPRICPEHLELEEKKRARPLEPDGKSPPWTPTEDGQARLRSGEKLPIVDDMFLPILPCPRDGLLGPLAGATPPMAITLWVPGLPPNSRPLHPTGALFANQGEILSIRNLLHTQQAIRFTAAGGSRGLLYPKEYSEGIGSSYHEIQPTRGIFLLPDDADRRYLLWFRGLYLPCTLETLGKAQRFLRLAAPLPCDGRLGEDVGPFLPLRARMYSEDGKKRLLLRQGPLHERLWSSGGSNWSGGSLSFEWADHGFAPKPPESPTGRYAWRNHVWRERGGAIDFEGWVIPVQGGYTSPGSGSFSSWGIRIASQPQSRTITIFDSEFEQLPAFPEPVQAVLREILEQDAHSGGYELDSPEGKITISPVFSSPLDPKPSRIRIEFPAGSGLPDVRLFFAEGR